MGFFEARLHAEKGAIVCNHCFAKVLVLNEGIEYAGGLPLAPSGSTDTRHAFTLTVQVGLQSTDDCEER